TAAELGWVANASADAALVGGYAQPFGNWADLSVTLGHERWRARDGGEPRSVAYLCGPLPDARLAREHGDPRAGVRQACAAWLARARRTFWPRAFGRNGFEWGKLIAAGPNHGRARFDAQFFRA